MARWIEVEAEVLGSSLQRHGSLLERLDAADLDGGHAGDLAGTGRGAPAARKSRSNCPASGAVTSDSPTSAASTLRSRSMAISSAVRMPLSLTRVTPAG